MVAPAPSPLYDIAPLEPAIERGLQLLTPNRRLARRIKLEWDRRRADSGQRAWQSLAVASLEPWLIDCWRRRCAHEARLRRVLISPGQALALWRQVILDDQAAGAYQLLRTDAAARLAQQARDALLRHELDIGAPAVRQAFALDPDCAAFLRWCEAFEQRLEEGGMATALDALQVLAAAPPPDRRPAVLLLEFDELPPLLEHCLRQVCSSVERASPGPTKASTHLVAFPGPREELASVAQWARRVCRERPAARVGIVLADMRGDRARLEYLLRREFDCLGSRYAELPVNFSTGWSLAEVPVVRDALALLDLLGEHLPLRTVLQLLRSRFIDLPDRHSPASLAWVSRLHELGREQLAVASLRNLARGEGSEPLVIGERLLAQAGQRQWREAAPPSVWMARFRACWESWGWPGSALDSLEYQQLEHLQKLLDELAGYDEVCGQMRLAEACALLRRAAGDAMFQPQTEDSSVQVLGPLEAAGLQFDALWVVGMQASQWPAPARPNPLLPVAMQRESRMPHASAEREWDYATGLLAQYRRACGELWASYAREVDGAPALLSALVAEFPLETFAAAPVNDPAWLRQQQSGQRRWLADELAPPPDAEELAEVGGGSGLIEDQAQCPFRAFARRRLRAQALEEAGLAPGAAVRGQLVHDALFALWGELRDLAGLLSLEDSGREALIGRAVDAALDAMHPGIRARAGAAWCSQEAAHLRTLLREWLAVEAERGEFAVAARESSYRLELAGLELTVRVDRVDRLPDGRPVMIDYKTGSPALRDWLGERPSRPQLPLYSLVSAGGSQEPAALAFARLRPRACEYIGLGERAVAPGVQVDMPRAEQVDDWGEMLAVWRARLERLAEGFLAGEAAVDPLNASSCTWCGLQALCRVELRTPGGSTQSPESAS